MTADDELQNYPDYYDVCYDSNFSGIAWVPTAELRWANFDHTELEQCWRTTVIRRSDQLVHHKDPQRSHWRRIIDRIGHILQNDDV